MGALPAFERPAPIRVAAISPRRITVYMDRSEQALSTGSPRTTDANLTRGVYNGYMSPATRRHIRRSVGTWIRSVWTYRLQIKKRWEPGRPYMVFVTLTLPSAQIHDDRQINRECLTPFIAWLKRAHGIVHYFWRAEAQINGNVHYHILCDRYIDARDLQAGWCKYVNALGYVDRYYEASGKADPPCTDVHRITDKVKDKHTGELRSVDPVEYLLDYVTDVAHVVKDGDQNSTQPSDRNTLRGRYRRSDGTVCEYAARPVSGRIWGMSDAVRVIREPRVECDKRIWGSLERAVDRGELRAKDMDHAVVYWGNIPEVLRRSRGWLAGCVDLYHLHVFRWLYPWCMPRSWVDTFGEMEAHTLWINGRTRRVEERGEPYLRGEPEYMDSGEELWITELRRTLSDMRFTPQRSERLILLALKYNT